MTGNKADAMTTINVTGTDVLVTFCGAPINEQSMKEIREHIKNVEENFVAPGANHE